VLSTEFFPVIKIPVVAGATLSKWLEADPSFDERQTVSLRLLSVFKEMHAAGIVHGDAHNDNFIISEDLRVTAIDFGSSKFGTKQVSHWPIWGS
jgi:tRNA A-37 threonylcarbamoyl transferase component Bud32